MQGSSKTNIEITLILNQKEAEWLKDHLWFDSIGEVAEQKAIRIEMANILDFLLNNKS